MENIDLYKPTLPLFTKMLRNLLAILDKGSQYATSKKFEMEVVLQSRLAPDQFAMGRQIQIACDTAKLFASRMTGKEAPVNADDEKTLADFKTRIEGTIAYLEKFSSTDFKGSNDKHITQTRWEGKYLTGEEYTFHHVIPNFYFHITTAYAILRHNGVDIGKKDYLGALPFKS